MISRHGQAGRVFTVLHSENYKRLNSNQRGYNARWKKARATYLKSHPLCVMCDKCGYVKAAFIVDHIIPHKGNQELFWDKSNWQSLCKHCHDSVKQRIEKTGEYGCNVNGIPEDKGHHWNE